jgi:hypothetical protein
MEKKYWWMINKKKNSGAIYIGGNLATPWLDNRRKTISKRLAKSFSKDKFGYY